MTRSTQASAAGAVRAVYDAHYGMLVGWTTKLVSDPDLAHDLVTEAFVRLLRNWGAVDEPRAWLYTTTANLVRDHWRKRGREAVAYERMEAGHSRSEAGDEPLVDPATRLTVRQAVESLPSRLRLPVLLHYYADLTVAQVARQLGKSEGTIKRDLYDARGRMAAWLEEAR
ncbi:MAG TPA: sigma-70 family RNA polymerase sigma factor [Segeticoccus sp.]|nr:sigma-70 family RNA polymerase sigma factor [Segeticoccus sp.]